MKIAKMITLNTNSCHGRCLLRQFANRARNQQRYLSESYAHCVKWYLIAAANMLKKMNQLTKIFALHFKRLQRKEVISLDFKWNFFVLIERQLSKDFFKIVSRFNENWLKWVFFLSQVVIFITTLEFSTIMTIAVCAYIHWIYVKISWNGRYKRLNGKFYCFHGYAQRRHAANGVKIFWLIVQIAHRWFEEFTLKILFLK